MTPRQDCARIIVSESDLTDRDGLPRRLTMRGVQYRVLGVSLSIILSVLYLVAIMDATDRVCSKSFQWVVRDYNAAVLMAGIISFMTFAVILSARIMLGRAFFQSPTARGFPKSVAFVSVPSALGWMTAGLVLGFLSSQSAICVDAQGFLFKSAMTPAGIMKYKWNDVASLETECQRSPRSSIIHASIVVQFKDLARPIDLGLDYDNSLEMTEQVGFLSTLISRFAEQGKPIQVRHGVTSPECPLNISALFDRL